MRLKAMCRMSGAGKLKDVGCVLLTTLYRRFKMPQQIHVKQKNSIQISTEADRIGKNVLVKKYCNRLQSTNQLMKPQKKKRYPWYPETK